MIWLGFSCGLRDDENDGAGIWSMFFEFNVEQGLNFYLLIFILLLLFANALILSAGRWLCCCRRRAASAAAGGVISVH